MDKQNKINCWEFKKCGREPGGKNLAQLGVCIAAVEIKANGLNGGKNAGRTCWAVAGTLCEGKVQGTFALKIKNCLYCDFYKLVLREEGRTFTITRDILSKIKKDGEK